MAFDSIGIALACALLAIVLGVLLGWRNGGDR